MSTLRRAAGSRPDMMTLFGEGIKELFQVALQMLTDSWIRLDTIDQLGRADDAIYPSTRIARNPDVTTQYRHRMLQYWVVGHRLQF